MNRLQWYNASLQFQDPLTLRPLFGGWRIQLDESVAFHDLRKRGKKEQDPHERTIEISFDVVCPETEQALIKCVKCQAKVRVPAR